MKCLQCTTANSIHARFCQKCGTRLVPAGTQSPTATTQAPMTVVPLDRCGRRTLLNNQTTVALAPVPTATGKTFARGQREQVLIVQDISGSMAQHYDESRTKMDASTQANVKLILNKFRLDPLDEIGLIIFTQIAQLLVLPGPLTTTKQALISATQSLTADGGTDIDAALRLARDSFDWTRSDVVRRVILQTDGDGGEPLATARELKSRGVIIDVIGVGDKNDQHASVKEELLKQIASVVAGELRYKFIADSRTLITHYTDLAQKTSLGT